MSGLLANNLTVAAGTTLSRATGLLRFAVLAAVIGDVPLADAYILANEAPNIVYELLLGGVLSATLVPLFSTFAEDNDDESANVVISTAVVAIAAVTAVAVAAAPLVFRLFSLDVADGVDPATFRSAGSTLARIFLIQILFYGIVGLANAFLNSRRRFFAAAWSPILPNVVIVAALLSLPSPGDDGYLLTDVLDDTRIRLTLGLGATVGIGLMAVALLPAMKATGFPFRFVWSPRHAAVRRVLGLSVWTLGFVAANIVALIVVRNLTEPGLGSFAYLAAFTFFVLPHGLLGVSIATTFQPEMSRSVARRDRTGFIDTASLGVRMTALFTIPAGVGLFVLRQPLVGLVLQNGQYGPDGADNAARALGGFALGLGAFSVYFFVLRGFYAHKDTKTAFTVNAVENLINIVLAVVLVGAFDLLGLGLAYAIAYALSALWALQILSYKVPGFLVRPILKALWPMAVAAALMGEAVWFVARNVGGNVGIDAAVRLGAGTITGAVVYFALLMLMRAPEVDAVRRRLAR